MPEASQKLSVFLCHASGDKPAVRELHARLLAEGWIDPWLDEEKLYPGQDWDIEIEKAVEAAHAVIVFLSKNSVNKEGYVQRELRFVLDIALTKPEETIFVIPLRLEACELPRRLRAYQFADYFPAEQRERAYERLLYSLKLRAKNLDIPYESNLRPDATILGLPIPTWKLDFSTQTWQDVKGNAEQHKDVRSRPKGGTHQSKPPVLATFADQENDTREIDRQTWGGIEFVRIPAGKFLMGSKKGNQLAYDDEQPQHEVDIPYDYWLARFPLTNAQYNEYIEAKGGKHPLDDWQKKADHPVASVSWEDAMNYCRWLDGLLKGQLPPELTLRLPTEAEWEKAARGTPLLAGEGRGGEAREWPWGNTFDKAKCNTSEGGKGGTTPVGSYSPQGDSPYGCADMVGNVCEWMHSLDKPYPYRAGDGREDEQASGSRVLRGGSFFCESRLARCAFRFRRDPDLRFSLYGFRVVVSRVSL
jgi:formylglycine-generating enzyme required for sulfatase activity